MKELTIEEKAKRYDEAIKRAEKWRNAPNVDKIPTFANRVIEEIFPELKESEDERIREAIIDYFENCNIKHLDWIAWLEKQGEQKPNNQFTPKQADILDKHIDKFLKQKSIDKAVQKFKVGDEIKTTNEEPLTITKIDEKGYWSGDLFICDFGDAAKWELVEQKPAWSEDDEYVIERLFFLLDNEQDNYPQLSCDFQEIEEFKDWLKSLKDRVQPQQEWKQENTDDLTDFENAMMHIGGSFFGENAGLDPNDTNVIKEQANLLLELVPSKEWSEEDESYLNTTIAYLKDAKEFKKTAENCINWLKSLRPQNAWKPSDEQMNALDSTLQYSQVSHNSFEHLNSLFNDLKKLKGE